MKTKRPAKPKTLQPAKSSFDGLLRDLREFITESRRQVLRAVDVVQVRTCWGVGRHIVEFEQGGAARAEYGAKLLLRLAVKLTEEFGRGFDASNLRYMRLFSSKDRKSVRAETKDFYIDLVFYNYLLKCFVIFDLKPRELTHGDIKQMDMYVRVFDEQQDFAGDINHKAVR